ncbi:hypothetical protein SAY86_005872 [Trapa natans]|uniref:RRM domain-containing protein n=1 Tax=Trapa natans TaxID=22666 RepID=A0AAN7QRU1_TRANT|nr:hypothetical protein SAY86_005872 [Trapa natans]
MRRDAGLPAVGARNGERAALASEATFEAALRTEADRKMDLAEAREAISSSRRRLRLAEERRYHLGGTVGFSRCKTLIETDTSKISAYRDLRFSGTQEEFEQALLSSTTVYVGNMSFYTTEEQVYELFSRAGEIKKIIMGLDKKSKTPCGFCFVLYYSREDTEDAVKYVSGTILDDRPVRVDFDWGFQDGRQWGRGKSGGQVSGYGKLIQKELEAQRQLVDYGVGSLGTFQPAVPLPYGRPVGGGSHRYVRDYPRKRNRDDDRRSHEPSKRARDYEFNRNSDPGSRTEKNPRFRESGDSDEDEEDDGKRHS